VITHHRNVIIALVALLLCVQPMSQLASAKSSTQLGLLGFGNVEDDLHTEITQMIGNDSQLAGYWANNSLGTTTTNVIYSAASGEGHTYSITFYIGEGDKDGNHWFIDDASWNDVYDNNIYYHSDGSVRFALLWACHQGETIGGFSGGVPYGMPFAWLHYNNLSSDGYNYPDNGGRTFIGWNGDAPFLDNPDWSNSPPQQNPGYEFLCYFYLATLCFGWRVRDALDYAARSDWGV
jgi:hypothetical protein